MRQNSVLFCSVQCQ